MFEKSNFFLQVKIDQFYLKSEDANHCGVELSCQIINNAY